MVANLRGLLLGLGFRQENGRRRRRLASAGLARSGAPAADSFARAALAGWVDGVSTTMALLVPLAWRLSRSSGWLACCRLRARPTCLLHRPAAYWPGWILACPLVIWTVRRLFPGLARQCDLGSREARALKRWAAVLAFAPLVAWLGNPLWWRETLTRLAHYLMLNAARRGVLPDIPMFYRGQTYLYSVALG